MESPEVKAEFMEKVVKEFERFEISMKPAEGNFPHGGVIRDVTKAFMNGKMRKALINSVPHITNLINSTAQLKLKVSSKSASGALDRLNTHLKSYTGATVKVITRIDQWHKKEGAQYKGRTLQDKDYFKIPAPDLITSLSDRAREMKMLIMTADDYMKGGEARTVSWPK